MGVSKKRDPDISVVEFGRLEDYLEREIQLGRREFSAAELNEATDLSVAKVYEALRHLEQKHEHVTELGAGRWRINEPE